MTQTNYEEQKSDHLSWMQWINENLNKSKGFYKEVKVNLSELIGQVISRISKELFFFISKLTPLDLFFGSITLVTMSIASIFMATGFGLLGYQIFLWVKNGVWSEFAIIEVFNFLFKNTAVSEWLSNPESWFGLQKIMEWILQNIPLSVALIVPSIIFLIGMIFVNIAAIIFRFYQFKAEKKN